MSSSTQSTAFDPVLLDLFRAELETHTRVLEEGLVTAEAMQSPTTLEPLMRAAHSIKGAARMLGMEYAVRLAHAMEEILVAAQHGTLRLTAAHVDALLRGNDVFLRAAKAAPANIAVELEQQNEAIEHLIAEVSARPVTLAESKASSGQSNGVIAEFQAGSPPPVESRVPTSHMPKAPASNEAPQSEIDQSVRVRAACMNRLLGLAGECLVQTRFIPRLIAGVRCIQQRQKVALAGLERTADLLRQGDTCAAQNELEGALKCFSRDLVQEHLLEFDEWTRRLEGLVEPLYAEAIASRMRPFSEGTHGFARMIRDLAKSLGKKVCFEIEGASTPVDRDILEGLESPLTHLLRNALDHGIELPADRITSGKPESGKLLLSAHQVSGMLRIAISDDGAGIDVGVVLQRIIDGGYLSQDLAQHLSEGEILEFLFLPGFSTARTVTEISGRGVGLDVVQSAVRAVGGSVNVQSKPGAGTTVELRLPLTLSIVRCLLVEIGGEIYGLPLTQVDRLLRTTLKDLQVVEDRQFCDVEGLHVGLLDASQVLEARRTDGSGTISVVVISDRLNCYGLVVDRFLGERDLAVKPLPSCLGKVRNISAGAILDNGTPTLILDTDDLVRSMDDVLSQGSLQKLKAPLQPVRSHPQRRILVVDDSITVREVERRLLQINGYDVAVAVDGMDGWNALQRTTFDLLITDVDMPRMDGLELVRRVRAAPRLSAMPIVIVSYKEQPEHRIKGMEAGANYYLAKSSFNDESLVSAVRDLIGEA